MLANALQTEVDVYLMAAEAERDEIGHALVLRNGYHNAIHEITGAQNKAEAKKAIEEFGVKWPKASEKIVSDEEALLAYYDCPAENWRHLRTTNPIESPFATVRARMDITKGPGSREAGVAMIFKLLEFDNSSPR
jgi:transposase-like protein